jgi:hypothetical protein
MPLKKIKNTTAALAVLTAPAPKMAAVIRVVAAISGLAVPNFV